MIGVILSTVVRPSYDRIVYRLEDGTAVFGPFIERRPSGGDHQAFVNTQAASSLIQLNLAEIDTNEQLIMTQDALPIVISLRWSTASENSARIRQRYLTSKGMDTIRIARYINSLALTDAQMRNLFGITQTQLNTLKTKFTSLIAKWTDVQAQAGE